MPQKVRNREMITLSLFIRLSMHDLVNIVTITVIQGVDQQVVD